jgi:hypothetical protein
VRGSLARVAVGIGKGEVAEKLLEGGETIGLRVNVEGMEFR